VRLGLSYGCVRRRRIWGHPAHQMCFALAIWNWIWCDEQRRDRERRFDLRPKEFLLIEYLVRKVNRPVTRTMLVEHVWNCSFEGLTNVVDVHMSALRGKVDS
jgi:DNA-binding response OmpR family regulator